MRGLFFPLLSYFSFLFGRSFSRQRTIICVAGAGTDRQTASEALLSIQPRHPSSFVAKFFEHFPPLALLVTAALTVRYLVVDSRHSHILLLVLNLTDMSTHNTASHEHNFGNWNQQQIESTKRVRLN